MEKIGHTTLWRGSRRGFSFPEVVFSLFLFMSISVLFFSAFAVLREYKVLNEYKRVYYIVCSEEKLLRDTCSVNPNYSATKSISVSGVKYELIESCEPVNERLTKYHIEVLKDGKELLKEEGFASP